MVHNIYLLRDECLDVLFLIGFGIETGKVIAVVSDWMHKGGLGNPEMLRREGSKIELSSWSVLVAAQVAQRYSI